MQATKTMNEPMTKDDIAQGIRFDPHRVESLVLDELGIKRSKLLNITNLNRNGAPELARVVIALIITDHCGKPGRSEQATRKAIAKQIVMKAHTYRCDLQLALESGRLDSSARAAGFDSAIKFHAYIIGMLELTQEPFDAA